MDLKVLPVCGVRWDVATVSSGTLRCVWRYGVKLVPINTSMVVRYNVQYRVAVSITCLFYL
jgi:hypothetical protein